jgi:diadenosine tetraphosphate (Ap4A) HIT family hydrolase
VSETPEQLYERAKDALRRPPLEEWETFPFEGEIRPRALLPPEPEERPRAGEGGRPCWRCALDDTLVIWHDDRWLVHSPREPTGLPIVVMLQTQAHVDLHELDGELAADLGPMLVRAERAVAIVPEIGRVHVCKWGDGTAHLHFWFMGRPARLPQLIGSFAAIWDDVLPPTPEGIWRENLATVARVLAEDGGEARV